jgi:uncharacterized protein
MELERAGVRIDACRNCRGVWLDRGELDRIIEQERRVVAQIEDDDEDFLREMSGGQGQSEKRYGFDKGTAERLYSDYRDHKKHKQKKRKSFLDDLFD